jgi:competence protein ComEC
MPSSPRSAAGLAAAGWAGARSLAPGLRAQLAAAISREAAERRFFLWIPVAAIGGVALNLAADREPSLWAPALIVAVAAGLAFAARRRPALRGVWIGVAALFAGFLAMGLRTERVRAPVLDHIRIVTLQGFVEEIDFRTVGARFVMSVSDSGDMPAALSPRRVRLTARKTPDIAAGDFLVVKARLLPPSRAVLPGGYDFARDAYFQGVGAVGSALGAVVRAAPTAQATLSQRFRAALDRARNRLALRVDAIVGGDEGAIAAAMVTGKRDFLSSNAKDLIREAGIFHIITISGVQMTLVAGIFFVGLRRLLALSPTLALNFPIKKIAALFAMLGALGYDIATGSRVGTERALIMTVIVLGAAVLDRRALTMRNLALAVLVVVALEPEAVMGVSFQLSFAAVAALIAVMEARLARPRPEPGADIRESEAPARWKRWAKAAAEKVGELLFATLCASAATLSFMAYHFHDVSPYVLIGNPLTLTIIELFAVPGALMGTALYPLGLDAWVWLFVGAGVKLILFAARLIAEAPGSTLHVRAFAPWSLPLLSLAVLSAVIWRSLILRATGLAFLALGLVGAFAGPRFDVIVPPSADEVALRDADGRLALLGKRNNAFAAEQWLAADGDDRDAASARVADPACDRIGCVGDLPEGQSLSLVYDRAAFEEDCARAAVVVSALTAPSTCKPARLFDERRLAETGAVGLEWDGTQFRVATDRSPAQDRPWSPAPRRLHDERLVRPPTGVSTGADPADAADPEPP